MILNIYKSAIRKTWYEKFAGFHFSFDNFYSSLQSDEVLCWLESMFCISFEFEAAKNFDHIQKRAMFVNLNTKLQSYWFF